MKHDSRHGILTRIARFLRDPRGVSAIEFAFVFPVMVLLYLGGTAVTQGVVLKRKTTLVTRTIGDLVSQYTQIVDTDKTAIFNAATAVINPYPAGQLSVIVSSVIIDANGNAKIDWSEFHRHDDAAHPERSGDAAGRHRPHRRQQPARLRRDRDLGGSELRLHVAGR